MALFTAAKRYPQQYRSPRRQPRRYHQPKQQRMILIEEVKVMPEFMKRLDRVCHNTQAHPLPVKMKFIAESTSYNGQPMVVYACPYHGCTWREGWVQDYRDGNPHRLWAGYHDGR